MGIDVLQGARSSACTSVWLVISVKCLGTPGYLMLYKCQLLLQFLAWVIDFSPAVLTGMKWFEVFGRSALPPPACLSYPILRTRLPYLAVQLACLIPGTAPPAVDFCIFSAQKVKQCPAPEYTCSGTQNVFCDPCSDVLWILYSASPPMHTSTPTYPLCYKFCSCLNGNRFSSVVLVWRTKLPFYLLANVLP